MELLEVFKMIEVLEFTPELKKKTVVGYFKIKIPEWNLIIDRMVECQKDDRHWINPPTQVNKSDNGELTFISIIEFTEGRQEKFLNACKKALKEFKQKSTY